ncbi:MAG: enoyl-CoA hydratase/isomerase family protein [Pseudonocardiaceae bacterium]
MTATARPTGHSLSDVEAICRDLTGLYDKIDSLEEKSERSPGAQGVADRLLAEGHAIRDEFLGRCAGEIYTELSDDYRRELRVSKLLGLARQRFPGLVPGSEQLADEAGRMQKDKDGLEIDQGIFLGHVLSDPAAGRHLIHAMSQPRLEAQRLLEEFRTAGTVDLGPVAVSRDDRVGYVTFQNHRYLNAEDNTSTDALEIAIDLVLLDEAIDVGVLRGAPATHPKWTGRRVFGAGINLTHLYNGRISLISFFVNRELGLVDKMYRGHSVSGADPEVRHEKPWIAALDGFAIGGGCQFLLVMDRIIAEAGSYFNLPAGKEGIIPGCGVMRLPRFLGEGLARQAVLFSRNFTVESPEGRALVGDVVPAEDMQATIDGAVADFARTGLGSVRSYRKMLRISAEPVETFRVYMANYVREQAFRLYSRELIANLESTWLTGKGK